MTAAKKLAQSVNEDVLGVGALAHDAAAFGKVGATATLEGYAAMGRGVGARARVVVHAGAATAAHLVLLPRINRRPPPLLLSPSSPDLLLGNGGC
jgi:hypothetical protein